MPSTPREFRCNGCKKHPNDIPEYAQLAHLEGHPDALTAMQQEEGTYNSVNGHFWCTDCYIEAGEPLGVAL